MIDYWRTGITGGIGFCGLREECFQEPGQKKRQFVEIEAQVVASAGIRCGVKTKEGVVMAKELSHRLFRAERAAARRGVIPWRS